METAAQDRAEWGGDEWSVTYAPLEVTRRKSSQSDVLCELNDYLFTNLLT